IYFKRHYPQSEIVAFEPDEAVFRALESNVRAAGYTDVQLHKSALWSSETELEFLCEGSDGGRLATSGDEREKRYNSLRVQEWSPGPVVQTTRLCTLLERHVDFLKLDLEGAETEVLQDCRDRLRNVDNVFVEYHSVATEPQTLATVVKLLVDAGFRLQIHQVTPTSPRPFMTRYLRWGMDMQLSIFGTRAFHDTKDHAVIARQFRRNEA
ncbi:MAG: FkbM family methyltransferase, partial [Acidobacteria bacterium]|nr:FkbM family methyltransferase [Acidobacteriota bacterium]